MEKVVFVTNYLGNGGAARVMSILANNLIKNNIKVEIISFLPKDGTYEINKQIEFIEIKCNYKNRILKKIERIMRLRRHLRKNNNTTIIAFEYFVNMQTILANLFLKNRIIVSERNDPNRVGNGIITKRLRNILYRYATVLVCQTNDAKEYFPKKIQEKTVIIPNPIMPNLPKRFEGERNKEIVTFCRIEKQKNLKMLLDAYKMLIKDYPEYKLFIYGDGKEKDKLIEYTKSENLDKYVNFKSFEHNIHDKIIKSSMFVSSSDYEGISNSMIEAMGIGLPTISTDCPCGGARMMIENNVNGILVPVKDTMAMYVAMKKIIEDKKLASFLSNNAIKINDILNEEKICLMWKKIL